MQNPSPSIIFDEAHAASYDQRFAKVAPLKDALHLLMQLVFSELPADARILCVGAGTGAELIYLAQAFPRWHFTAVEPSPPMLNMCRQRAEASGITARCTFHEGFIDTLSAPEPFDAATSILVSQFILQLDERRNFFAKIAEHLRPGGILVSADLSADTNGATYSDVFEMWTRVWKHNGAQVGGLENLRASFARDVAVLAPTAIESILVAGGFAVPVLFCKTFMIHAWYAKRSR